MTKVQDDFRALSELFNIKVRPLATPETIGGFYEGFRLIGVYGVIYKVPDLIPCCSLNQR